MIISMPTIARPQQRYDHRLRHLVQRTGDVTVATGLGVPRSTARGWLGSAPRAVVCLDVADLTEPELRQEVLKLRRRVLKLTALLRLALVLLRPSGFRAHRSASAGRTRSKRRILRAVDRASEYLPFASGPAVPACVAESVPCLAPAAERLRARRSVLLSPHITVSTDAVPTKKAVLVVAVDVANGDGFASQPRCRGCSRSSCAARAFVSCSGVDVLALAHQLQGCNAPGRGSRTRTARFCTRWRTENATNTARPV
jgi:hypothetical protein